MKSKPMKLSDPIRRAIDGSGMSRYAVCKAIRLSQSTMSRFMHATGGLSVQMLDRIGEVLGLEIVAQQRGRKAGEP